MGLQLSREDGGRILTVTVSGKLTGEDYEAFVPEVDRLIKEFGKINILFHMRDFHGWSAAAMWEDTKFAFRHFHDIGHLAVVGEKSWQKGMTVFCKPFTKAEIRYFDHGNLEEARRWLKQEEEAGKPT